MSEIRTPYPLSWPTGWPRAKTRHTAAFHKRVGSIRGQTSKAELTMVDAREQLQHELDAIRAGGITLSTNVELTLSGMPRSGQTRPSDVGVACYFKLKGRDTVLACDKWTRVEDNIVAIAKHINALRAQERWGVGTVEQAFTGYQALPAPVAKRHWTSVLGVGEDASIDIINTRYRALSKGAVDYPGGADARQLVLNMARDEALAARTLT